MTALASGSAVVPFRWAQGQRACAPGWRPEATLPRRPSDHAGCLLAVACCACEKYCSGVPAAQVPRVQVPPQTGGPTWRQDIGPLLDNSDFHLQPFHSHRVALALRSRCAHPREGERRLVPEAMLHRHLHSRSTAVSAAQRRAAAAVAQPLRGCTRPAAPARHRSCRVAAMAAGNGAVSQIGLVGLAVMGQVRGGAAWGA